MNRICLACGDSFDSEHRLDTLRRLCIKPAKEEMKYCLECASEVFRGIVSTTPAKTFYPGRGCPLEGGKHADEDMSPWGENAMRSLEDN